MKDIMIYAFRNMRRQKKRTTLTLLGIMVGIAAFTSIQSLSAGFQRNLTEEITSLFGANTIIVAPEQSSLEGGPKMHNDNISWVRDVPHVKQATGALAGSGPIITPTQPSDEGFTVLSSDLDKMEKMFSGVELAKGEVPDDTEKRKQSLFMGQDVPTEANLPDIGENVSLNVNIPIGDSLQSLELNFTLRGKLEETTQSMSFGAGGRGLNPNTMLIVSLERLQEEFQTQRAHVILCEAEDQSHVDGIVEKINDHFGEEKIQVITSKAILSSISEVLDRVSIFLLAIASMSLLVAGLGIMNTMTMSVTERTKEIGILKSIGATNQTVLAMFLSEAFLMSIIGGGLGLGMGYLGGFLLGRFIAMLAGPNSEAFAELLVPVLTPFTIGVAFGLSIIISLVFAFWPSRRAANYDPVKALRFG